MTDADEIDEQRREAVRKLNAQSRQDAEVKLSNFLGPIMSNIASLRTQMKIVMLMLAPLITGMVKLVFFP